MKKDERVFAVHENGLGDYVVSMKFRSQINVSGIADLVKEMFEQSELYDIVKYYKPYFTVKRIDSSEEISQAFYDEEPEIIPKKFKPYRPAWSTKQEDIDYDTGVIGDKILDRPLTEEPEEVAIYRTDKDKKSKFPCQSCVKVDEACIPTDFEGGGCGKCPYYENRVWANILKEKEKKDRFITNKELAMWLSQGKGQVQDRRTGRISTDYYYFEYDDSQVDYMNIGIRKWGDDKWYEPTYNYCFGDK